MKGLFEHADQIPVTMVTALAYVTLALVTGVTTPTLEALHAYGALMPLLAPDEPWRLLTYAYLHGGLVHIVFNMSMLLAVGPMLERSLGSVRFAVLYVAAAIGGGLLVCLWTDPRGTVVGGSGALFGMLGAALAMNMRAGRHPFAFLEFEGPRRLVALIAVNLLIGWILPMISNSGHVGGLVAGFAVTLLWLVPPRRATRTLQHWRAATIAAFAGALFASLVPATRFDWLWNQSVAAADPAQQRALRRAAAMAYFGMPQATDADVQRLVAELFAEQPDPDPPPRGR